MAECVPSSATHNILLLEQALEATRQSGVRAVNVSVMYAFVKAFYPKHRLRVKFTAFGIFGGGPVPPFQLDAAAAPGLGVSMSPSMFAVCTNSARGHSPLEPEPEPERPRREEKTYEIHANDGCTCERANDFRVCRTVGWIKY